ncbi:MAG: hypothetical protein ABSE73_04175 [Planctomycetota bacterium]
MATPPNETPASNDPEIVAPPTPAPRPEKVTLSEYDEVLLAIEAIAAQKEKQKDRDEIGEAPQRMVQHPFACLAFDICHGIHVLPNLHHAAVVTFRTASSEACITHFGDVAKTLERALRSEGSLDCVRPDCRDNYECAAENLAKWLEEHKKFIGSDEHARLMDDFLHEGEKHLKKEVWVRRQVSNWQPQWELMSYCGALAACFEKPPDTYKFACTLGWQIGILRAILFRRLCGDISPNLNIRDINLKEAGDRITECCRRYPDPPRERILSTLEKCVDAFYAQELTVGHIERAFLLTSDCRDALDRVELTGIPGSATTGVNVFCQPGPAADAGAGAGGNVPVPPPSVAMEHYVGQQHVGQPQCPRPLAAGENRLTWKDAKTPCWGSKPFEGPPQAKDLLRLLAKGKTLHWEIIAKELFPGMLANANIEKDEGPKEQKMNRAMGNVETAFSRLRQAARECWGWDRKQLPDRNSHGYYLLNLHESIIDKPPTPPRLPNVPADRKLTNRRRSPVIFDGELAGMADGELADIADGEQQ